MVVVRALLPAFIMTFLITALLAATGTRGGILAIEKAPLLTHQIFWSWPIFAVFTGVSWMLTSKMK